MGLTGSQTCNLLEYGVMLQPTEPLHQGKPAFYYHVSLGEALRQKPLPQATDCYTIIMYIITIIIKESLL